MAITPDNTGGLPTPERSPDSKPGNSQQSSGFAQAGDALSPCVGICTIDENTGWCIGCGRSRDEIATWLRMTVDEKREVLTQLDERKLRFYEE